MPRDQISYDDITYRVGNGGDKSGSLSPFTFLCFALVLVLFGLVVLYSVSFPMPLRALRKSYLILYPLAAAACVLSFFPGFSDGGYIVLGGIQVVQPGSLALIAGAFLASDAIPEAGSIGGGIVREYLLSFIFLTALLALTLFIPGDLLLSGNYLTIQRLGLLDSWLGIISTSLVPASQILMLRQFFLSIPSSIRDSAAMDGASDRRYIISILIPISRAVISTLLLQSFVAMFNSYLWPLLVTNRTDMRTVQIGITMLGYAESLDYGPIFAAIVIVLIPFLAVFILMHRRIMASLRQGYMFM